MARNLARMGELHNVGAITLALLDDEAHANLDKKRKAATHATIQLGSTEGAATKVGQTAGERSFGLAPAVAKRLAAVVLLSLRDTTAQARLSENV